MWILPLPLPADARVRLPPGRHRFPWYHTTAETERLAQLLAGLLEGVDRHLIVPWSTARSLADARTQPALATTLLVVTADDPELDDDRIDEIIRRIACPHAMVKLPRPGSLGYAWQERHIKPALISLLHEHLGAPEHPLASLHIDALPVKLAASLTTDVLELIELLEATAADRMAHAAEGISPGDYERSLLEQAGRALAARLLRLRMDQVPGALGIVLAGGRGTPDDEDFRQGAEALEAVGLARYMGGGLSLGPLARRANEPVLRTALLRTIPEALHAPPAPAPPSSRRAREALASEPQPAAAPSAISPGRYDDLDGLADLLAEVQTITRLRHGEATIEVVPAPPPVRFHLRVTERAGDISDVRVVAAVEGEVTDDYLQSFLRDVVASYRSTDPGLIATLVYSGRRPSEALVRRAAMQRVHLVSFTEYQEIIDLRGYVERQTARLERDAVYPPSLYVDQRAAVSIGQQESTHDNALALVSELLGAPQGRFVLVLGDFGTGKTFLLHELARRMGRAGGPVVPVLIEMRALEKARTLDALLAQHFALSGMSLIDLAAFDYLLKNGRIALLFDGFDELALRVTYDRAAEHFETLVGAVRGRAKIVATSRTQHFLNDQQIRTALGARAEQIPGARMVKLLPFTEPQIRRFLVNRLLSEERAEARLRLIADVKDLLGLAENPRMLSFIAQIEDDELLEAQRRDGQITAAGLYRLLLERWIGLEFERAHPRGALSGLTEEQRWHAITELASRLWLRTEGAIDLLDLPSELVEAIQALGPEPIHPGEVTHQIGTGTLLVRDEQGRFSFIHQSVLEWLVANAAADEVQRTGRSAALAAREMSLLMTDFFCDLAGREAATAWASRTLGEGDSEIAVRNALQVQHLLGIEVSHRLDLAGKGLRGQDLSGRDLRGANLQGADLSAARLVGADLEGANLRGARLAWADLSRARLAGADLSAADLTNARLLGADLRGAKLAGVRARNAALVGATLDEGALDKVNVFGAALPHPERIGVRLAASPPTCNDLAASSDGSLFASAHGDGAVRLWNAETGRCIRLFRIDQGIALSVAMRADGSMLAAGYANGSIRLWSIPSGAEVAHLTARRRPVRSIAFSPNGRSLAFVSVDGGVDLWNMRSGKRLRPVADQVDAACVAFSPDGRTLAFDVRKTVRLWNVASGTERPSLQDHRRIVWSFGFSPDGQWLAACSTDGIRLWHVASGRVQQVFRRPDRFRSLAFSSLAFSSDSKTLATGTDDSTILLWDLDTGVERHVLRGREGPVRAVAFSAGGAILASASEAGIIRLWSPITGEHLATLLAAPEGWAAVLPDGRYKLGGDSAGTFRHAINGVHFAPGQLDPYIPGLRLPDDEPLLLPRPPLLRGG